MSKLLKKAKKYNLIRNLSYADIVDDSDWDGLVEEAKIKYNKKYHEKDIIFVRQYKYQNEEIGTNHLFVIMEEGYGVPIEYFCFLISSKVDKIGFSKNYYLKKDNHNHLNKDSIVKTDVIYEIAKEDIICKIGEVSDEQYKKYEKEFLKIYA